MIGIVSSGICLWLRTGCWPVARSHGIVELKFNPYHDPRNGRFTFAPGGHQSLSQVIVSHDRRKAAHMTGLAMVADGAVGRNSANLDSQAGTSVDPFHLPGLTGAAIMHASFPRVPRASQGSNIRAFQDPMTLQQAVPGLQGQPGGAIVPIADSLVQITGPAQDMTAELTREWSNQLIGQIRSVDPDYRFDSLGFPQTLQGQINQLNTLRFDQAAAFLRVRNEVRPCKSRRCALLRRLRIGPSRKE